MTKVSITMDDLLENEQSSKLASSETVEGTVISVRKNEIWLDLGSHGIGLVPRREIGLNRGLKEGDTVVASVVEADFEDGHSLLSLRKAAKDRGWDEVKRIIDEGETIEVIAHDANRGGLLIE